MGSASTRQAVRAGRAALVAAGTLSCQPELPDEPFLCQANGACPSGFSCEATLCVRDEVDRVAAARPMRTTWINSAEMYFFESKRGGADLVVNDGFTAGERALYEIHVDPDGTVAEPKLLLDLAEDFPTSTAVVALDDSDYAVVSLRFPSLSEDSQTLTIHRIERDSEPGVEPRVSELFTRELAYLGGTEPAYIGAVVTSRGVETCFVDPAGGGTFHVVAVADGEVARDLEGPLPDTILPLSGDCLLWARGDDLTLRLGLEAPTLFRIPANAEAFTDLIAVSGVSGLAMYPFAGAVASLVLTPRGDGYNDASLAVVGDDGVVRSTMDVGRFPIELEPHTAWRSHDGVLFAPGSSSDAFTDLRIFKVDEEGVSPFATLARTGTDPIYSSRAFTRDGVIYLAWTALHGDLMDLWVATAEGP